MATGHDRHAPWPCTLAGLRHLHPDSHAPGLLHTDLTGTWRATGIARDHLEDALRTIAPGKARTSALVTERDRTITAWHEAGHALAALVQPAADDPVTVTIVPRGPAGGVTWMAGNDRVFLTRHEAKAKLVVALAGRAAEELLLDGDFTQGRRVTWSRPRRWRCRWSPATA